MPRIRPFVLALILALCSARSAADEPLVVVVPAGSGHRIDSRIRLAEIYREKLRFWPDGQKIEPVNLPAIDSRRRWFSQQILGWLPEELDAYWNEMYFHGVVPPVVLNSPEAVLRFMAITPGAVGYVPYCSADSRVVIVMQLEVSGSATGKPWSTNCRTEAPVR